MTGAVVHQCFEVIQSSRFPWLLILYIVQEELSICLGCYIGKDSRYPVCMLFESVIEKVCMWDAVTKSHPVKHFGFPQSLCFPYLPFISMRSLCYGQACCVFSCNSARNYLWCCLLLSPSWQTDCISTLWAIHLGWIKWEVALKQMQSTCITRAVKSMVEV